MVAERDLAARFSEQGLRPTPQRLLIYRYLLEHRIHPSVDTIYSALLPTNPALSRTTVYNTLHTMEKAGLVHTLPADMAEGEQRFDVDTGAHGHFYCQGCGKVYDLSLGEAQVAALCPADFAAESGNVLFRGRCPDCCKE